MDWFHILVIFVLIPMAWEAGRGWRCAYILLTALYVLQFAVLEHWRKGRRLRWQQLWQQRHSGASRLSGGREMLSLEIQLIPAAGLSGVWAAYGGQKEITNLQTVLYCLCLGAMASDALSTGAVWDALILEAVNLAVFTPGAYEKMYEMDSVSGIIMILVALLHDKDFWLSLSWVGLSLLATRLGLIVFAAVNRE